MTPQEREVAELRLASLQAQFPQLDEAEGVFSARLGKALKGTDRLAMARAGRSYAERADAVVASMEEIHQLQQQLGLALTMPMRAATRLSLMASKCMSQSVDVAIDVCGVPNRDNIIYLESFYIDYYHFLRRRKWNDQAQLILHVLWRNHQKVYGVLSRDAEHARWWLEVSK